MIDQREILWGVLAPPVLMAVGMLVSAHLPARARLLSTGALLALVFALCQLGFRGWAMPGANVHDWPAWIALAGGALTLCATCCGGAFWARAGSRLVLTTLATWLLLRPQLAGEDTLIASAWVAGLGLAWAALVLAWERVHQAATPGVSVLVLAGLAGVSAASLLLFNSITHAQSAGILTAALTAALVLGWWRPAWYGGGAASVAALVLPALWLLGQRYADLPLWALPLLGLAGLAPLAVASARVRAWATWKRLAVAACAALLLAAPVLAWGVVTSLRATAEPAYGY